MGGMEGVDAGASSWKGRVGFVVEGYSATKSI